jgi:hypothetical protein
MIGNNNSRELAIKMEFSFNISMTPVFGYFLMKQFFYVLILVCLIAMVDALFVSLVNPFCENCENKSILQVNPANISNRQLQKILHNIGAISI